MSPRNWPVWLGIVATAIAMAAMIVLAAGAFLDGVPPANPTALHELVQPGLRGAFLFISLGAMWQLCSPLSTQWRWAVGGALTILTCGVAGELAGAFIRMGWLMDFSATLGAADSVEQRLFRLGAMAAYAVPMLVLLAAAEHKPGTIAIGNRFAALLVRWEPVLFAIGAVTLASVLLAGAFINKELTWLSPIGSDATVAACVAATMRARRRADGLAFGGWLMVTISMAIGLVMGSYSFGGPLPTPAFIGDYNALPRTLLRDGHVILISAGVIGIAVAAIRKRQDGVI